MNPIDILKKIALRFPESLPYLTQFPSGAGMLDLTIRGVRYCIEYLPSYKGFGLSKIEGSMPFWEGVDEAFESGDELEKRVSEMMTEKDV